eukprot:CAMPEP_0177607894 /NCGR_PEP_ID=MMETSP0419_2-20121207/18169_1 /TAXON_ID=582737 /ORGANISM="Tetraselmis sp., Strain GSL018" /LENGTH=984 /DNA_ID=CAMNT_0019102523 /DNA_START=570 /DNA_END=3525 /DNA_ORIENTATION=+
MVDNDGQPYGNEDAWYIHLSSDDYPRLFLKQMVFGGATGVAIAWYKGHDWASTSARTLETRIEDMFQKGQSPAQVVYSYGWEPEIGGRGVNGSYDTGLWDEMLLNATAAGAEVLIVYGIDEGASIMQRVSELRLDFEGIYITVAPGKPEWSRMLGAGGDYVVSPGQWSPQAVSPCVVFGSISDYVELFNTTYGYVPDYDTAMSSFGGIVIQLAMQEAGSVSRRNVLNTLSILTAETIMGRVRFSIERRNIGRDPVLMQIQDRTPRLVLPQELAVAPLLKFVDWECRILVDEDTDPDVCTDEELLVYERCVEEFEDRINGAACLLRLETERVRVWNGSSVVSVCTDYPSASAAMDWLEYYNDLGNATLLFEKCDAAWFGGATFRLNRLREVDGAVVFSGISLGGAARIELPALYRIRGDLILTGLQDDVHVEMPQLEELGGGYLLLQTRLTPGARHISVFVPKLRVVRGPVRLEGNQVVASLELPVVTEAASLELEGNGGDFSVMTMPNLRRVFGDMRITGNEGLRGVVLPQLRTLRGDLRVLDNLQLVELSFALLTDMQGKEIRVNNNGKLAFFNLAQAETEVNYCSVFAQGDLTGNRELLNLRTLWFEPSSCEVLRADDTKNICPAGYLLVHGEGDEARCDEDWRGFFIWALLFAIGMIALASLLVMYQRVQFRKFYCLKRFTGGRPIAASMCGFDWHGSINSLLLSTVDLVSDIIFIRIQIQDNACRNHRYIITASLLVLIISSAISTLRTAVEVVYLALSRERHICFFPRPAKGSEASLLDWAWCFFNGLINVVLVCFCVTGLEPLRMLPWDRPDHPEDVETLEERDFMPDWFRFVYLKREDKEGTSIWRKVWLYVSTLSFFDQFLGIAEDVSQFVLQVQFLTVCHPSESAALTTLLSLMFSILRAGLKFTQAASDEVFKTVAFHVSKSMMFSVRSRSHSPSKKEKAPAPQTSSEESNALEGEAISEVQMGRVALVPVPGK